VTAKGFRYIKVHEDMPDHPKVQPLSDAAFRLLVSSWCWSRKYGTDGAMPVKVWSTRRTAKVRAELVSAGLVHADGDRVRFHDFLEWQKSADDLEAAREQRRSAGQAGGLAKAKRAAKQTPSESLSEMASESLPEGEGEKNKTPSVSSRDLAFEEFWLVYPRKVGKGAARKSWDRAVKAGTDTAVIIAAAIHLARQPGREDRFTPHPATWLNAERWLDVPAERSHDPQYAWDV
jgi:hypothetical protein